MMAVCHRRIPAIAFLMYWLRRSSFSLRALSVVESWCCTISRRRRAELLIAVHRL
jgi:hypothetical protein